MNASIESSLVTTSDVSLPCKCVALSAARLLMSLRLCRLRAYPRQMGFLRRWDRLRGGFASFLLSVSMSIIQLTSQTERCLYYLFDERLPPSNGKPTLGSLNFWKEGRHLAGLNGSTSCTNPEYGPSGNSLCCGQCTCVSQQTFNSLSDVG